MLLWHHLLSEIVDLPYNFEFEGFEFSMNCILELNIIDAFPNLITDKNGKEKKFRQRYIFFVKPTSCNLYRKLILNYDKETATECNGWFFYTVWENEKFSLHSVEITEIYSHKGAVWFKILKLGWSFWCEQWAPLIQY